MRNSYLFLVAIIKAVDEHQDLIRLSAASAGNDHRLGSNEAPPAIISIFLGDELTEILQCIEDGSVYQAQKTSYMEVGVGWASLFCKRLLPGQKSNFSVCLYRQQV